MPKPVLKSELGKVKEPSAPKSQAAKPVSYPGATLSSSKLPGVAAMQEAMRNFASEVSKFFVKQDLASGTPAKAIEQQAKSPIISTDNISQFGNFLAQNYNSPLDAKETDPDLSKTHFQELTKNNPYNFNVVIQRLFRTGAPKSEDVVDGNWGERTNSALNNTYAVAHALVGLNKDLSREVSGGVKFDDTDLKQLKDNIPSKEQLQVLKSKPQELNSLALNNAQLIRKLTEFAKVIINANIQTVEAYVSGTKPLATIGAKKKEQEKVLTKEESDFEDTLMAYAKYIKDKNIKMIEYTEQEMKKQFNVNPYYLKYLKDGIPVSLTINIKQSGRVIKNNKTIRIPLYSLLDASDMVSQIMSEFEIDAKTYMENKQSIAEQLKNIKLPSST